MAEEFNPSNKIVRLCLQGMAMEGSSKTEEGTKLFAQAWSEATHDFEKFISAYFLARNQKSAAERLKWFETALQIALATEDVATKSAFPSLYSNIAQCHEDLNDPDQAKKNHALAASFKDAPFEKGPFFHGTKADLKVGDLLTARGDSNYKQELKMNHIYFTAQANGAGLAAAMAKGGEKEHVYVVEPTGPFENDPNVTDKKFPGNLTRSYRSEAPLRIVGEVLDWARLAEEELEKWRKRVSGNKGEIIN